MKTLFKSVLTLAAGLSLLGSADAATIFVTSDISTSTTWTANNEYRLVGQIYVFNGATLTIEPGTVIASVPAQEGSLAVAAGSKIMALGTQTDPIIFTSTADTATWAGGDPKTGSWREAANEWGNLTLMGEGYISEDATPGNVATPNANNKAAMEGLLANPSFPGRNEYGGGNDDDDSGCLNFVSLRYAGKVLGLGNELNGLSLGGIGRETDIHHVEIMNNVDDGVEIWGGTVNLKYLSVWNIGDDSIDIDQGWRGRAQFILIVQGWSLDTNQGGGVGDNCFETDGAEDSDYQPVTTAQIYNATVIGQPLSGDGGTTWRDNAKVQYRNCIFMDLGDQLVRFDNDDGDGANGYGHNGTLSWADHWTTDYTVTSTVNAPANPADFYQAQTGDGDLGKLCEISDSVFFNNNAGSAYTESDARGVTPGDATNDNVIAVASPITSITRGPTVIKGGLPQQQVLSLDPRPVGAAATSANGGAPVSSCFYTPADYRGAFAPNDTWLYNWTASYAYGFTPATNNWQDRNCALAGTCGKPELRGFGDTVAPNLNRVLLHRARPNALAGLFLDFDGFGGGVPVPFKLGTLKASSFGPFVLPVNADGVIDLLLPWQPGLPPGFNVWFQYIIQDPEALAGFAISNVATGTQS